MTSGSLLAPVLFPIRFIWQTVFLALGQIWANKTRAVLTTLGIIIGVFAVIVVTAILSGMKGWVLNEFETFGAKKMYLWGRVPESMRTTMSWTEAKLSIAEADLILERAPSIDILTPLCDNRWDIAYGPKLLRAVEVAGVWPEWHEIEDRNVIYGRPLSRIDVEEARAVCLVNETAIDELGLDADPTGDFIQVDGRRFLIVGLVETKQLSPMFGGGQARSEVYIPFSTHKNMNPYTWTFFILQLADPGPGEDIDGVAANAQAEVRLILRNHRQLDPDDEDTFGIEVLRQLMTQFDGLAAGITAIAGGVVGISLLVGGIGIMNIMLVSVSERTREIGLRKAVGAKPPIVLTQFLVEAVVLCVIGGLIGVVAGQGVLTAVRQGVDFLSEAVVPPWAIVVALGFSAGTGVVFGMFPAIKAARLNPIDALRHE